MLSKLSTPWVIATLRDTSDQLENLHCIKTYNKKIIKLQSRVIFVKALQEPFGLLRFD